MSTNFPFLSFPPLPFPPLPSAPFRVHVLGRKHETTEGGGAGPRFSLADIAAKAKATTAQPVQTVVRTTGAVGGRKGGKGGGVGSEVWAKLLCLPRVVFEVRNCTSRGPVLFLGEGGGGGGGRYAFDAGYVLLAGGRAMPSKLLGGCHRR